MTLTTCGTLLAARPHRNDWAQFQIATGPAFGTCHTSHSTNIYHPVSNNLPLFFDCSSDGFSRKHPAIGPGRWLPMPPSDGTDQQTLREMLTRSKQVAMARNEARPVGFSAETASVKASGPGAAVLADLADIANTSVPAAVFYGYQEDRREKKRVGIGGRKDEGGTPGLPGWQA